jgi:hypothetical protein
MVKWMAMREQVLETIAHGDALLKKVKITSKIDQYPGESSQVGWRVNSESRLFPSKEAAMHRADEIAKKSN